MPFTIRDGVTSPSESTHRSVAARVGGVIVALSIGSALGVACTSSTLTSTAPSAPKCQVSVTSPAAVVAGGGTTRLSVSAQPECGWVASSGASWIADVTPTSGQGNGDVEVRVIPNPAPAPRQGNVQINDGLIPITQEAAACQFQVTPTVHELPPSGGLTTVEIAVVAGCAWTALTRSDWISVRSGATGNGRGTVTLAVAANPGHARSDTVTVAGQTVTVTQPAQGTCAHTIAPLTSTVAATGGQQTITVTTAAGCSWVAASGAPWITVTSATNGIGTGTVGLSFAANPGAQRVGTVTIAGQIHTVTQAPTGTTCSYTMNPASLSIGPAGGVGLAVAVTAIGNCTWTAASNAAWITVSSGATGAGSRTVTFAVAVNTGAARSGGISLGGQLFTVSQTAAACAYSINPTSLSIGAAGATGSSVSVTAAGGCAWTGVSMAPWITVTSGASGSGNGSLAFTVGPNSGAARVGSLTIAGQTYTVNQAAPCTYSISPTSQSMSADGGVGQPIAVTTASGCAWTAQSHASWINITTGANGSGAGTVTFSVDVHKGKKDRKDTMTIAGQTFTVTQLGEDD